MFSNNHSSLSADNLTYPWHFVDTGRLPGYQYSYSASVSSNGVSSPVGTPSITCTMPLDPVSLTLTYSNSTYMLLSWSVPSSGQVEAFIIQGHETVPDSAFDVINVTAGVTDFSIELTSVEMETCYAVTIWSLVYCDDGSPYFNQTSTGAVLDSCTS